MTRPIILDRRVVADRWQLLIDGAALPDRGDFIVPLARLGEVRGAARARQGDIGVLLAPGDDPAAIAGDLADLRLIAIDFPVFTDGRGYSLARLLRERHLYQGELRAVGDVGRDQMAYLERVGFNAFALKGGADPHAALAAFATFSDAYQASVAQPLPHYRRRAGAPAP